MMVMLDFQFAMCTAATAVLNTWRSSGPVVAAIPATPYPDERYRTKMLWWNRRDFFNHAQPEQLAKIVGETKELLHEQFRRGQIGTGAFQLAPRSAWQKHSGRTTPRWPDSRRPHPSANRPDPKTSKR